jgi:hypothetical protein
MKRLLKLTAALTTFFTVISGGSSYGQDLNSYISTSYVKGSFVLSSAGKAAPIRVDDADYAGVIRAAKALQKDIFSVTKTQPPFLSGSSLNGANPILIGTIGKSKLIDDLVKRKKLRVDDLAGKWETYLIQVVESPMPGVKQALVIAGSDKRGTIFGIYDVSAKIGVSPWYWWADVPVKVQKNLYVLPGLHTDGEPAVKYRGIFINDEAPSFSGWAQEKFGGINHKAYEKVFELILRLKGNYLWPAMWGNAFNDDDKADPVLADEYGIVMGTSHHEPMNRAQQEWKRYGTGTWNYETNGAVLRDFWRKGIENMGSKETLVTVGMRGDGDMPMTGGSNIALLEKIVNDQRKIIADVTGKDAAQTPQIWALYKEVQAYYDKGMRVPDDVTLLLCDDNWGDIRKLPKLTDPKRKGGYGIYYHFDYVGDPRNYKWLNTNPISKTWEQMHLAYAYGAKQVWIVNVGDLKPMEFPISFFMDYAWSPDKWPASRLAEYTRLWARQQFGQTHENEIAGILTKYTMYNARRKPELLDENTYSLTNYHEFETAVRDYDDLRDKAKLIYKKMPEAYRDAYYELVLHPVEACSNLNDLYFAAAKNHLYAVDGNSTANDMAEQVKLFFVKDAEISGYYNDTLANGKWNHMMDQTHIGYTYWQQPEANKMPDVKQIELAAAADMGVAVEGSEGWWPKETSKAALPEFNSLEKNSYYVDIFNRGQTAFGYKIMADKPWIKFSGSNGTVSKQQRVWISVDWDHAPIGLSKALLTITGAGKEVTIEATVNRLSALQQKQTRGFIENNGYIAMEAGHFTRKINGEGVEWIILPGYGRTFNGVTTSPVTAKSQQPDGDSPHLEYRFNLADTGVVKVEAYISPTLDFTNTNGLHYAVSIDDEQPQVVNINADESDTTWRKDVANNIKILVTRHHIAKPGVHILKYWAVDPGVVLQKIVIDAGGEKPSYLGPPESYRQ